MGICPFGCLQFFHANKFLSLSLYDARTCLTEHEVANMITFCTLRTVHGLPLRGRLSADSMSKFS